jgi:hypothetical protein
MSLLKMTILSFSKTGIKQLSDIPQVYMVMFNPNSYKSDFVVKYAEDKPANTEAAGNNVEKIEPKKFSFDFIVDGTGAAGYKRDVGFDVTSFIKTVGYDKNISNTGTTRYLLILWGSFIQKCQIESISVNYTLFSSLGSPLRATISATFREYNDAPSELMKKVDAFFSSAPVQGAMSVANVAFQAFNSVSQTVAIAKANDLDSIRAKVDSNNIKLPS